MPRRFSQLAFNLVAAVSLVLCVAVAAQVRRRRPDLDLTALIPQSRTALHARVDEWLAVGFSKFILRPAVPPTDWTAELETLAADILERQT